MRFSGFGSSSNAESNQARYLMLDNHEGPLEGHLRDALWMVVDRNCPSMVPAGSNLEGAACFGEGMLARSALPSSNNVMSARSWHWEQNTVGFWTVSVLTHIILIYELKPSDIV